MAEYNIKGFKKKSENIKIHPGSPLNISSQHKFKGQTRKIVKSTASLGEIKVFHTIWVFSFPHNH